MEKDKERQRHGINSGERPVDTLRRDRAQQLDGRLDLRDSEALYEYLTAGYEYSYIYEYLNVKINSYQQSSQLREKQ